MASGESRRFILLSSQADESSVGHKSFTVPCTSIQSTLLETGSYARMFPSKSKLCATPTNLLPLGQGYSPFGSSSRNWPVFNIVGAGGQNLVAATSVIHCHAARKHLASSLVPGVPSSVNGAMNGHHWTSSSLRVSTHACNYLIISHMGLGWTFLGEPFIT